MRIDATRHREQAAGAHGPCRFAQVTAKRDDLVVADVDIGVEVAGRGGDFDVHDDQKSKEEVMNNSKGQE